MISVPRLPYGGLVSFWAIGEPEPPGWTNAIDASDGNACGPAPDWIHAI